MTDRERKKLQQQDSGPKACAPCREAHQACDKGRPCGRCRHLNRTHLCRDPRPPLRRRGRPTKDKNYYHLHHSTTPLLAATHHLQPTLSRVSQPYPFSTNLLPSTAHSPLRAPLPSSQPPSSPYRFLPSSISSASNGTFSSSSSSAIPLSEPSQHFASSLSPSSVVMEREKAAEGREAPLLALYCHRCGVEFLHREASFCMSCGLKRSVLPSFGNNDEGNYNHHQNGTPASSYGVAGSESPTKKRKHQVTVTRTATTFTKNHNKNNCSSNVYNMLGTESEDSSTSQPNTSSPSLSSSSPCSSSPLSFACADLDLLALPFDLFPSSFSSSSNSSSSSNTNNNNNNTKNGIIKLWLPPMAANTRKPGYAAIPYFSKAHLLECFVDNQLTEPWALIRPFAFDSTGGSIVAVNSAFVKMFGYSQRELLGRSFRRLIPEELFEITEMMYDKMLAEFRNMRNCQVLSHDTCTITAKDGRWLMSQAVGTFYFGAEGGGPICISVQMKSAIPVQKSVAIEWSKQAGIDSLRVAPQSTLALPKDVRFHEGSFFSSAPVTSLSTVTEFPVPSSSSSLHSSTSIKPYSSSSSSNLLFSPLLPTTETSSNSPSASCASSHTTTPFLDLLATPTIDWLDAPSSSSSSLSSSSQERFSQECASLCEPPSPFNGTHPPCYSNSFADAFD